MKMRQIKNIPGEQNQQNFSAYYMWTEQRNKGEDDLEKKRSVENLCQVTKRG